MKSLSIGEVARRTGIRTSALRYYEEVGILPAPARVNGRRVYDAETIRRVDGLRFAQQAGFTLAEIKTLFQGFSSTTPLSARWQKLAREKLKELDSLSLRIETMRRALELGLSCGCVRIEDCLLSPADIASTKSRRPGAKGSGSCSF
jgi:MerR family redox-sensitive transcriptional activator SoxR